MRSVVVCLLEGSSRRTGGGRLSLSRYLEEGRGRDAESDGSISSNSHSSVPSEKPLPTAEAEETWTPVPDEPSSSVKDAEFDRDELFDRECCSMVIVVGLDVNS